MKGLGPAIVVLQLVCLSSVLGSATGDTAQSWFPDHYDPGDEAIPDQSDVSSAAGQRGTPESARMEEGCGGQRVWSPSYEALLRDVIADERALPLGPASVLHLSNPVVGDVRLISRVYNEGPGTMTYLDVYSLYPETQDRQEILDIDFYPTDGALIQDSRGQNVIHWHFERLAPQAEGSTYWQARVRTRELRYDIAYADVASLADIPWDIAVEFLADDGLFQIHHPTVVNAVRDAVGREGHPRRMAERIFRWVQDHLSYSAEAGWDDAPTVIERGNGSLWRRSSSRRGRALSQEQSGGRL